MDAVRIKQFAGNLKHAAFTGKGATIGGGKFSAAECKAAAIALDAAPAMLAALQMIHTDDDGDGYLSAEGMKAVSAAIAAATGAPTDETGAAGQSFAFPRIAAQGERFTYWEVSRGVFNVSRDATGGYASPEALAKLKGDTIKPATGER